MKLSLKKKNNNKTKEDYSYMAKLYLASLKFRPSLWVVISSNSKIFCCQIRDLEIKSSIYKKSVDVLTWWSECYMLKNNNTNNSSIIIITSRRPTRCVGIYNYFVIWYNP